MTCDNRRGQARVSSHCCTETMSRKMERKEERDGNEKRRRDDTSASANRSTQQSSPDSNADGQYGRR